MADKSVGTESFATAKAEKVDKKIRLAIIGCGGISGAHLDAYKRLPEFEIVAGCDIKPERLDWFHERTGCEALYEDWRDMFKEVEIDAVDVCTPNGVHKPAVIAAVEAGCHVITEKPMAMNPLECQEMIDAAKKAGKLLCCGFQMRYHPLADMFVRAREAGDIGDILYVKVHAMRRRGIPNWGVFGQKALQGGGPMIDIGVHMIEAAHYCIGAPKPVAATGRTWQFLGDRPSEVESPWPNWDYKTYTVEDLAVGQVRFDNGVLMQIESSFCAHLEHDVHSYEIMGTKGGFHYGDQKMFMDHAGTMINITPGFLPSVEFGELFVRKLKNFGDAIRFGTPLRSPGEAGMAVQKIINGIYSSAEQGGKEFAIL